MSRMRVLIALMSFGLLGIISVVAAATKAEEVAKYLKEAQTSKDVKTRVRAINDVGELGALQAKLGEPAIPVFIKLLDDKDAKVRGAAAMNIGRLDLPDKKEVVEKLSKMLKDDASPQVREDVARGLAAIGPDAKDAAPALREALGKVKDKQDMRVYQDALMSIIGKKK